MDQFDIEGMFNGTVAASWMLPFGQQDANFLTGSRQMLEPIIEETSEDDEESILNYQHYENGAWSSESDTGSVIRIELHNDQDTISERDFVCPAKRARRDEILNINLLTIPTSNHLTPSNNNNNNINGQLPESPRRFNIRNNNELLTNDSDSLINPLSLSSSTSSTNFRRRFDDFIYSDSDSLSYNSLSRSSSLIQFESLERQLQNELSSSSIGSSPSLLSFDAATEERNSNRGSSSSLKRFESSDGRLHQTYLDLDKIDFDNTNVLTAFRNVTLPNTINIGHIDQDERQSKSDSESSSTDNSILSHEERILIRRPMNSSSAAVVNRDQQNEMLRSSNGNNKGKSSVENLSEDSGYCEHNNYSALRTKSKSIPNFLRTTMNFNEKFYEEDEFENHKSLEELYLKTTCSNNNNNGGGSSSGGGGESYSSADDDIPLSKHSIKDNNKENIDCIIGSGQKQQMTTKILKIGEKYNNNSNNKMKLMKNSKFIEKSSSLSPSPHSWYNNKNKNKFSSTSPSEEESSSEEGEVDDNNNDDDDDDENDNDDSSDCNSASAQFTWNTNTNTIKTNLKNRNFQYSVIPSTADTTNILNTNFQYSSSSLPDIRVELNNDLIVSENYKNSNNSKLLSPINNNLNAESKEIVKNSKNNLKKSSSKKYLSSSNNDLYNNCEVNDNISNKDKYLTTVSSVPKDLNLLKSNNNCEKNINGDSNKSTNNNHCHDNVDENVSFSSGENSLNWNKNQISENRIHKDKNTTHRNNFGNNPIEFSEFSLSGKTLNSGSNYMNASYNNITLLDYSLTGPPSIIRPSNNRFPTKMSSSDKNDHNLQTNTKRCSREFDDNDNPIDKDKRNSSLSSEFELGKGNFLLDEISAHFDKNLSILSDRHCNSDLVSEFLEKEKRIPPKPPARRSSTYSENRYSANLSQEKEKSTIENEKLEKPIRHNENHTKEKTTFDLDPTNLITSYTESLERCNFNPKELSTSDLTQLTNNVRHHSTPVKRNFVASTPNLNEFQHQNKLSLSGRNSNIDDDNDFQISSTSNSLIQLPIDKRLGILMATQSKNSLGKSVNFCPVVAEYSWREKSEDTENFDPDSLENLPQQHQHRQDESDSILIENDPNTTVIFGCDVTDSYINSNFNTENTERKERNDINSNTTNDRIKRETTFGAAICSEPKATHKVNAADGNGKQLNFGATTSMTTTTTISNISNTVKSSNSNANKNGANKKIINNKLNKNLTKMETNFDSEYINGGSSGGGIVDNDKKIIDLTNNLMTNERLNNNNNNNYNSNKNNLKSSGNNSGSLTKNQQQHQHNLLQSTTVPINPINNPEILNSKFKPKPDEKHHKSFLSRFAGGFRFSLRRKKQKQPINNELINNQDQKNLKNSNSNINNNNKKKSIADGAIKSKSSSQKSPDFIYIPLKGPKNNSELPKNDNNYQINVVESNITTNITPTIITADPINEEGVSQNHNNKNNHVLLLGKPPLPKQPPRVVGVSEKLFQQQQQQQRAGQHAFQRSSSQPRDEYDNNISSSFSNKNSILSNSQEFLDNERRYYNNDYQLNNTMNGIGCNINLNDGGNNYYDKKPPQPPAQFLDKPINHNNNNNNKKKICKIGLIETNLDTHETIISGKTRSLMELGPHYHNQNNLNHHQRHTLNTNIQKQIQNNQNHDDDDDCGPSVRRPHKSMEFLLDKENQKNIASDCLAPEPLRNEYKSPEIRNKLRNTLTWKKEDSIIEKSPVNSLLYDGPASLTCWRTAMDIEEMLNTQKETTFFSFNRPSWIYKTPEIGNSRRTSIDNFYEIDSKLRTCESPGRINRAYTLTAIEPPTPATTDTENKYSYDSRRMSSASIFSSRSFSHLPSSDEYDSMKDLEWQPFDNKSLSTFKTQEFCQSWQNLLKYADELNQQNEKDNQNDTTLQPDETLVENLSDDGKKVKFDEKTDDSDQELKKVFVKTPGKVKVNNSTPIRKQKPDLLNVPYDITKKSLWSNFSPISKRYSQVDVWNQNPSIWSRLENLYVNHPNNAEIIDSDAKTDSNVKPSNSEPIEIKEIPKNLEFSKFWISSDNCKINFNIFHISDEKLKSLHQKFFKKSENCTKFSFGIDDIEYPAKNFPKRLLQKQENKHSIYWFAADSYVLKFDGELLSVKKIIQVFDLLKGSDLKFGINEIEFSKNENEVEPTLEVELKFGFDDIVLPENKIESSTEPEQSTTIIAMNNNNGPIKSLTKTSDLEQSEFESDSDPAEVKQIDPKTFTVRSTVSSRNTEDNPRNSITTTYDSVDSGGPLTSEDGCAHDIMDDLFDWVKTTTAKTEEKFNSPLNSPKAGAKFKKSSTTTKDLYVSKAIIADLMTQRNGIRKIEQRVRPYTVVNENDKSENLYIYSANENTYQYFDRLQNMVKAIQLIGNGGYDQCTREQIEGYMYTLCRYADFCLTKCIGNPPENELQKSHDSTAALSEHQLRVQASLQRLNIPDWYRAYSSTQKPVDGQIGYKPGNFTRKRTSESGRWAGLNSKTTSLSSLGSQRSERSPLLLSPSAHSHHGTTHIQSGVGGTNVNPSGGFSRWSTSYLNSTQTSPSVSQRGSFSRGGPINSSFSSAAGVAGGSIRNSFRQPYMGWRSQEKINQPRTPHERLASSILAHKPPKPESVTISTSAASAVTPEIQSSIKEVTSAIVHYVNDQNRSVPSRSRSTSPNSRKCWLESSFVGVRPLESPQTPTLENNSFTTSSHNQSIQQQNNSTLGSTGYQQYHIQNYTSDILRVNGVGVSPLTSLSLAPERSPSSASLEDVLASLLGLPTESSSSYRSTGDTANEIIMFRVTQPTNKQPKISTEKATSAAGSSLQVEQQNRLRRRSEGDAQRQKHQQEQQKQLTVKINNNNNNQQQQLQQQSDNTASGGTLQQPPRRVSLDSSESKTTSELLIKCRNTKCDQTSNPVDAKKYFKSCHNCSHLYCSRECRRAHWEKHRKACLHSRVSNLCRQVLSACKDDVDTLRHLSLLARKGYLSQGRGVVRILFRSPESAEGFIKNGFQCMGEASYVRWPDLMPAEMGLELYSELLRLSTEYKTDTKMLLYVAICVVSEAPGTATAPVKWERQLVSRCAKLKLCKSILNELSDQNQQTNLQQQQQQNVPEPSTEILILTFNLQSKPAQNQREIILQNILSVLNRRGVILKKHYPEIYQRLQTFADGQSERFMPVTLHPRDSQTGQGFVCIIMPNELIQLPESDIGNHVCTIDVGEELLES